MIGNTEDTQVEEELALYELSKLHHPSIGALSDLLGPETNQQAC